MLYRHYKGDYYRVLFTGMESTNNRPRVPVVVYVSLKTGVINCREADEFHGQVVVSEETGVRCQRFALVAEVKDG